MTDTVELRRCCRDRVPRRLVDRIVPPAPIEVTVHIDTPGRRSSGCLDNPLTKSAVV
jgi:hypothetical protein